MNVENLTRRFVPRGMRNWIRSPVKSLEYVRDRIAHLCGQVAALEFPGGWIVHCHPASRLDFDVFRSDVSQAAEFESFKAHCAPGMRLLDVGAHHGFFALATLKYGAPGAAVVCVEPSPRAAAVLTSNLQLAGAGAAVRVVNAALGDEDGTLPMLTTGPLGGDYFVVPQHARPDTVNIPKRSLESIVKELEFAPTHLKMDVESYEYEIIHAGQHLLSSLQPIVMLELHGSMLRRRGLDPSRVIQKLRECGYRQLQVDGERVTDDEIASRGFDCRLVATTNLGSGAEA